MSFQSQSYSKMQPWGTKWKPQKNSRPSSQTKTFFSCLFLFLNKTNPLCLPFPSTKPKTKLPFLTFSKNQDHKLLPPSLQQLEYKSKTKEEPPLLLPSLSPSFVSKKPNRKGPPSSLFSSLFLYQLPSLFFSPLRSQPTFFLRGLLYSQHKMRALIGHDQLWPQQLPRPHDHESFRRFLTCPVGAWGSNRLHRNLVFSTCLERSYSSHRGGHAVELVPTGWNSRQVGWKRDGADLLAEVIESVLHGEEAHCYTWKRTASTTWGYGLYCRKD